MNPYTVLICDDKETIHESLSFFLRREGMEVLDAYDGMQALTMFAVHPVDLMILDVMLPDMDGIEICRRIRQKSDLPVIFLSARNEEMDRIRGLEIGGDDYVSKPYSPREIALRVSKLLQRRIPAVTEPESGQPQDSHRILRFEELRIDADTLEVFVDKEKIDMTAREVQLLIYLTENVSKVLNREQILTAVWGFDYYGDTRTVDATVKRIRKKLPADGVGFSIQSIYGVGYRLGKA